MIRILIFLLIILALILWYWRSKRRKSYRDKLFQSPISSSWTEILKRNVPVYSFLPDNLRQELGGHIQVFIAEKQFEGCGGLEITDEIKVTIAAQACILLLNRKAEYYPNLVSILVYPSSYIAESRDAVGNGVIHSEQHRAGESWNRGLVILSWDDVLHGASDPKDGQNVVFHEFAHQLDQEHGSADGLPRLEQRSHYISWARVLTLEFAKLVKDLETGHQSLMDKYGATSPAEFFAVATETFFEKPQALKQKHPELYDELAKLYNVNPIDWKIKNYIS